MEVLTYMEIVETCPVCQSGSDNANYCAYCGKRRPAFTPRYTPAEALRQTAFPHKNKIVWGLVVCALVFALLSVTAFRQGKNAKTENRTVKAARK